MELSQYFISLLRKGPAYTTQMTPELEDLQARHVAHTQRLMETGAAIAAGPVNDESDIRGFTIFRTATLAEAQALAEADPGVQAGRFVVELHRWLTLSGRLPAPTTEAE
ncbi:MAG TPA: YciI family protein [Ktedonobacterales bacterium]|nr:YciI family protein [Ktedonobacterales bacterium]